MPWADETDDVVVYEPILAKKDCELSVDFVEPTEWVVKEHVTEYAGTAYKAMKMTLNITDKNVSTEHEDARPRLRIEHQMNVERYPYLVRKGENEGKIGWLGRAQLYQLEEAFGFEPTFVDGSGAVIAPHITRTGKKVAPKQEGVKRKLNPAFVQAYFHPDGTVNPTNWIGKKLYADIGVERSDQYGDKNSILKFKPAPVAL